jgi:protein TonB
MIDWASVAGAGWRGWLLAGGLSVALHAGLLWSVAQTASMPQSRIAQEISLSLIKQSEQRTESASSAAETPQPAPSPKPTDIAPKAHQPASKPAKRRPRRPAPKPRSSDQHDRDASANRKASAGQPTPRTREADYSAAYLNNPLPRYPAAARRRGQQGLVLLNVEVLAAGRCGRIGILHGSGHAMLDDAAVEAVRHWHFVPAARGGIPVDHWVQIPIRFQLSQVADDR